MVQQSGARAKYGVNEPYPETIEFVDRADAATTNREIDRIEREYLENLRTEGDNTPVGFLPKLRNGEKNAIERAIESARRRIGR